MIVLIIGGALFFGYFCLWMISRIGIPKYPWFWSGRPVSKPNPEQPAIGWVVSFGRKQYFPDYMPGKQPFGKWVRVLRLQHFVSGFVMQKQSVTAGHRTWITYIIVIKAKPGKDPQQFVDDVDYVIKNLHRQLQRHVDGGGIKNRAITAIADCINKRDITTWNIRDILINRGFDRTGITVEIQKPTPIPVVKPQPNFVLMDQECRET